MTTTTTVTSYPWQPESFITGNLAIGNLRENLMKALKNLEPGKWRIGTDEAAAPITRLRQ